MTLRRRLILISLLVALPAAVILSWSIEALRNRDREVAVFRFVSAQLTDLVRDACEADPMWFLAGPRTGRPSAAERARPNAELYLPRPSTDPMPLEIYGYDQNFGASSTAAPRFPPELRRAFRLESSEPWAASPFETDEGEGLQIAMLTSWRPGPCAVLLVRYRPEEGGTLRAIGLFAGLFALCFGIGILSASPTEMRVRRLAAAARTSVKNDYAPMAPVRGRDEVSALRFIISQAGSDLRRRAKDVRDREGALQRHVGYTSEEVAGPLSALERRLSRLGEDDAVPASLREDVRAAFSDAHHAVARLNNLAAVARLRTARGSAAYDAVDLAALVRRVIARHEAVARVAGVQLEASVPTDPVTWPADDVLLEQAVANLVDNAILHNRAGGTVLVELKGYERDQRFSLRVVDDGPGITDDGFAALSAKGRFRGDEARSGRPGRGLGLAVAREVADRFGLQLDIRRPSAGGLEVELLVRFQ